MVEYLIVLTDACRAANNAMGTDTCPAIDADVSADDGVRTDLYIGCNLSSVLDNGTRMNQQRDPIAFSRYTSARLP